MITFYTIGCPQCKVLQRKLDSANIEYKTVSDETVMINRRIKSAPMLEVDGQLLTFKQALDWIKEQGA